MMDAITPQIDIVLDLPAPISVNALRRVDWSSHVRSSEWKEQANNYVLMAKRRRENPVKLHKIERFELDIVFDESQTGIDLDNGVKGIIDYLCYVDLIAGDAPKHLRKLTVAWGVAPEGTRVTVRPCS